MNAFFSMWVCRVNPSLVMNTERSFSKSRECTTLFFWTMYSVSGLLEIYRLFGWEVLFFSSLKLGDEKEREWIKVSLTPPIILRSRWGLFHLLLFTAGKACDEAKKAFIDSRLSPKLQKHERDVWKDFLGNQKQLSQWHYFNLEPSGSSSPLLSEKESPIQITVAVQTTHQLREALLCQ